MLRFALHSTPSWSKVANENSENIRLLVMKTFSVLEWNNCFDNAWWNTDGEIKWNPIAKVRHSHDWSSSEKSLLRVEIVKQKGLENITVDELVQEITPKGRGQSIGSVLIRLGMIGFVFSVGSWFDQEGNVGTTSSISLETWRTLIIPFFSVKSLSLQWTELI